MHRGRHWYPAERSLWAERVHEEEAKRDQALSHMIPAILAEVRQKILSQVLNQDSETEIDPSNTWSQTKNIEAGFKPGFRNLNWS